MTSTSANPNIVVILGSYNCERFISEQIETIRSQTYPPSTIMVSDDGSTDETRSILAGFGDAIKLVDGPRTGYANNYLELLKAVPKSASHLALSDQDDHWFEDKLERAITRLSQVKPTRPALYGSASIVCDVELARQGPSKKVDASRIGFRHAMAQNFAGGNTFVLNRAAIELVQSALPCSIPVHDWWLYLLISGGGGEVLYDDEPSLLYRQHPSNAIGANGGAAATTARGVRMLNGTYRNWNTANLGALQKFKKVLDPKASALVERVMVDRDAGLRRRVELMTKHGLQRQGFVGQAGLFLSLLLKKF